MSQAESEPTTADTFAAFATFLGTPLPEDPIEALRVLRREAAAEVERLLVFLDATDGDPDLEPTMGYVPPGYVDEAEGDNADDEEGDPGEDNGDMEPSLAGFQLTSGKADVDLEFDDADLERYRGSHAAFTGIHEAADGSPAAPTDRAWFPQSD